jgi:hypothetical protein
MLGLWLQKEVKNIELLTAHVPQQAFNHLVDCADI